MFNPVQEAGRKTASIHLFPQGGRKRPAPVHSAPATVVDLSSRFLPHVDFGSWYHEEAMREADATRKV